MTGERNVQIGHQNASCVSSSNLMGVGRYPVSRRLLDQEPRS